MMKTSWWKLVRRRHAGVVGIVAVAVVSLAACGESPLEPLNSGPLPRLYLTVWVLDAGDTIPVHLVGTGRWSETGRVAPEPGLLVISGTFWPGKVNGRLRRVTRGSVGVNGMETLGVRQTDGSLLFGLEAPIRRSTDSVAVDLPEVDEVPASYSTLRMGLATHASGRTASVAGGELRLPITRAAVPTVPSAWSRRWTLALSRGTAGGTRIDGTAELPTELVVPIASVLPGSGPFDVRLSDEVQFVDQPVQGRQADYGFSARVISTLRWPALVPTTTP